MHRSAESDLDVERLLDALVIIESAGNWHARGAAGELGGFQFRERTWHCFTQKPFTMACDPVEARVVAREYVFAIVAAIRHAGKLASPLIIVIAWNAGLESAFATLKPRGPMIYAQRVVNLYHDMHDNPERWAKK